MDLRTRHMRTIALCSIVLLFVLTTMSYYPLITLGQVSGMNLDISLLYVLILIVVSANSILVAKSFHTLRSSHFWIFFVAYVAYSAISIFWSPNHYRAVITAGFIVLLFLLSTVIGLQLRTISKHRLVIERLCLLSFLMTIGWALWQIIADSLHIPPEFTGLPAMYNGDVFGIARPVAFALEPQFFGSLLLIPLLWSVWNIFFPSKKQLTTLVYYGVTMLSIIFMLLTLSRGAIIASIVGASLLVLFSRPSKILGIKMIGVVFVSSIVALCVFFLIGSFRKDTISGTETVSRAINQLSFGTLTLNFSNKITPSNYEAATPQDQEKPNPVVKDEPPVDQGYVASSTTSRLTMSQEALRIWRQSFRTMLFGVGVGGFGATLHHQNIQYPVGSIVGNYYIEMLVETGIIGFFLFMLSIGVLIASLYREKNWVLLSIMAACLTQWYFFSGNANVTHIWIVIGCGFGYILHNGRPLKKLAR